MMCVAKKMCTFCFSNKMNVLSYITKHGAGRGQHRSVDMKTVKGRQAKCSHKVQYKCIMSMCLYVYQTKSFMRVCLLTPNARSTASVSYTSCKRVHNSLHVSEKKR